MSDLNSNGFSIIAAEINMATGDVTPLNLNGGSQNNNGYQGQPKSSTDKIGEVIKAAELLYALEEIEQKLDQGGQNQGNNGYSGSNGYNSGIFNGSNYNNNNTASGYNALSNYGGPASNLNEPNNFLSNVENVLNQQANGSNYDTNVGNLGYSPNSGGYNTNSPYNNYGNNYNNNSNNNYGGYNNGGASDIGNELLQELAELENPSNGYGNGCNSSNMNNGYNSGSGSNPSDLFDNIINALEHGNSGNMSNGCQPSGNNNYNSGSYNNGNSYGNNNYGGNYNHGGNYNNNGSGQSNNNEALVIAIVPNGKSGSKDGCDDGSKSTGTTNPDNKTTTVQNGFTVSSTGDPHLSSTVDGGTATTSTKSSNTPDLVKVKDTVGGSTTVGTKETDVKDGVSFNKEVDVKHTGPNGWSAAVSHTDSGDAKVQLNDKNGMHNLGSGQSFTEGDGSVITNTGSGATIAQQTKSGGSVTTTVQNQKDGLDVTTTGTGKAKISGYAPNMPTT